MNESKLQLGGKLYDLLIELEIILHRDMIRVAVTVAVSRHAAWIAAGLGFSPYRNACKGFSTEMLRHSKPRRAHEQGDDQDDMEKISHLLSTQRG